MKTAWTFYSFWALFSRCVKTNSEYAVGIQAREKNSLNSEHIRDSPKLAPLIVCSRILYSYHKPKWNIMEEFWSMLAARQWLCIPKISSQTETFLHKYTHRRWIYSMIIDISTFDMYLSHAALCAILGIRQHLSLCWASLFAFLTKQIPHPHPNSTHPLLRNHCLPSGIRGLKTATLNLKLSFFLSLYWTVGSDMQLYHTFGSRTGLAGRERSCLCLNHRKLLRAFWNVCCHQGKALKHKKLDGCEGLWEWR